MAKTQEEENADRRAAYRRAVSTPEGRAKHNADTAQRQKARRLRDPITVAENSRLGQERRRNKIFAHYGAKCKGCGTDDREVLTIDHVNDDGAAERGRKKDGTRQPTHSYRMYYAVINSGYSDRYQVLCANCQLRKLRRQITRRMNHARSERSKSRQALGSGTSDSPPISG